jgi:hypothetical protein
VARAQLRQLTQESLGVREFQLVERTRAVLRAKASEASELTLERFAHSFRLARDFSTHDVSSIVNRRIRF